MGVASCSQGLVKMPTGLYRSAQTPSGALSMAPRGGPPSPPKPAGSVSRNGKDHVCLPVHPHDAAVSRVGDKDIPIGVDAHPARFIQAGEGYRFGTFPREGALVEFDPVCRRGQIVRDGENAPVLGPIGKKNDLIAPLETVRREISPRGGDAIVCATDSVGELDRVVPRWSGQPLNDRCPPRWCFRRRPEHRISRQCPR